MRKINIHDVFAANSDYYGNPRSVIHYTVLKINDGYDPRDYDKALKLAKNISKYSRKYHNKGYGGGIVFNMPPERLVERVNTFVSDWQDFQSRCEQRKAVIDFNS